MDNFPKKNFSAVVRFSIETLTEGLKPMHIEGEEFEIGNVQC